VLVLALAAFFNHGTSTPKDPVLLPADGSAPSRTVRGFDEVAVRVHPFGSSPRGPTAKVGCDLLASTTKQQRRGLMHRTDLGGYAGMVFAFPADTTTPYTMRATPIALSIAWFDDRGVYQASATMSPCADVAGCPVTAPPGPYRWAIEVPAGSLGRLGLISGAAITVGGPCPLTP
jgi:uncharacterized membrane protein (UPF0127 family)